MKLSRCYLLLATLIFLTTLPLLAQDGPASINTRWTITNAGFRFVPDSITITLGDSVNFSLETIHNAVEVSQATWLANGNTSNGGFLTPFGGGLVLPAQLTVGTHYYVCSPHASMAMKGRIFVQNANSVAGDRSDVPGTFKLLQNYPNPFNPSTTIQYELTARTHVTVSIVNYLGQQVRMLYSGESPAGTHSLTWDATDDNGNPVAGGVYFYRLKVDGSMQTGKALLLK